MTRARPETWELWLKNLAPAPLARATETWRAGRKKEKKRGVASAKEKEKKKSVAGAKEKVKIKARGVRLGEGMRSIFISHYIIHLVCAKALIRVSAQRLPNQQLWTLHGK